MDLHEQSSASEESGGESSSMEEDMVSAEEEPDGNQDEILPEILGLTDSDSDPEHDIEVQPLPIDQVHILPQPGEGILLPQQQEVPHVLPIPPGIPKVPAPRPEEQDDYQIPPNIFVLEPNPMQPGGRFKAQDFIPQPLIQPRGDEDVQNPIRGKIPKKNKPEKAAPDQPGKAKEGKVQTLPKDNVQQGEGKPNEDPQDGAKAKDPTLPQNRHVAPQVNVLTRGMRQIMELLGKTHGAISPDERSKINQQLHDLIVLEPTFFSIYDLPIDPKCRNIENRRVFLSANKFKREQADKQKARSEKPPNAGTQHPQTKGKPPEHQGKPANQGRPQ